MATRRSNHEGTAPRQRADGRWTVQVAWVDAEGRRRRTSLYGRTRAEVVAKAKEAGSRLDAGKPATDARVTLAAYVERWIETTLAASDRKPSTRAWYAGMARKHVAASGLGKVRLDKVTPQRVEGWLVELRGRGLADSTVRSAFTVLRAVLGTAERDRVIASNPAAVLSRPRVEHEDVRALDPAEVRRLLDAAAESRFAPLFRLLVATGLRRGEALGLHWRDVDLDGRTLRVRRTLARLDGGGLGTTSPKSKRSDRTISLNDRAVAALREVRQRQRAERLRAGSQWASTPFVFTTALGHPVDPRNALRAIGVAARDAGLDEPEQVGLHTLRHTAASLMLSNGVPMSTVSRVLGHASIAVTVDLYGHVAPEATQTAADVLAAALDG